jgi:hypothetical protein
MRKMKFQNVTLVSLAVGLLGFNTISSLITTPGIHDFVSDVTVKSIDESSSEIHYSNGLAEDILFTKNCDSNSNFTYSMVNSKTGEMLGQFNSMENITFDERFVQNPRLCAAAGSIVWAAMTGGNIATAVATTLGAAEAAASNGTIVAAITLAC